MPIRLNSAVFRRLAGRVGARREELREQLTAGPDAVGAEDRLHVLTHGMRADRESLGDATTVDVHAKGFARSGFDGKYVYFAPPFFQNPGSTTVIVRCDTTAPFDDAKAWSVETISSPPLALAGVGAVSFDGRFMYFAPSRDGATTLLRFDARTASPLPDAYVGHSFY